MCRVTKETSFGIAWSETLSKLCKVMAGPVLLTDIDQNALFIRGQLSRNKPEETQFLKAVTA